LKDPLFSGESAVEASLPSQKVGIAVAVTDEPEAFDATAGSYANLADQLWQQIGIAVVPDDPPPPQQTRSRPAPLPDRRTARAAGSWPWMDQRFSPSQVGLQPELATNLDHQGRCRTPDQGVRPSLTVPPYLATTVGGNSPTDIAALVSVIGLILMTRTCPPDLLHTSGMIIDVASRNLQRAEQNQVLHSAMKAAVKGFSDSLRLDLRAPACG